MIYIDRKLYRTKENIDRQGERFMYARKNDQIDKNNR